MALDVRPYSIEELKALLQQKSKASLARIQQKLHSKYFESYFAHQDIAAATIVVENQYVDRDYLEDYASYYVRCFHRYSTHCCRLHFFKNTFTSSDLESAIVEDGAHLTVQCLQDNYIGFMVIRPLPQTIIGRTCLKTYGDDGGRRKFPVTRTYPVSLYGIKLSVETLGFQEQDEVAGQCATSALWTILQGTGKAFQHVIPAPAAISNLAEQLSAKEARRSPNRGLTDEQARTAIRSVDLEPLEIPIGNSFHFQSVVYAYLRGNIPLYLGVRLKTVPNSESSDFRTEIHSSALVETGLHAIALTGLSLGGEVSEVPNTTFRLRSTTVDRVYAHDDQVGPFARMDVREIIEVRDDGKKDQFVALTSSFPSNDTERVVMAFPEKLIVPLYHKIRIPFEFVLFAVITFDEIMKMLLNDVRAGYDTDVFTWDIMLVTGSDLLNHIRKRKDIDVNHRLALATKSLPRFYWQASLYYCDKPVMTVFFDATDLEQGDVVVHILEEDAAFCGAARTFASHNWILENRELGLDWKIWNWFRNNSAPPDSV